MKRMVFLLSRVKSILGGKGNMVYINNNYCCDKFDVMFVLGLLIIVYNKCFQESGFGIPTTTNLMDQSMHL